MNRLPATLFISALLVSLTGTSTTFADQDADSILKSLKNCIEEKDDARRLACYDEEIPRLEGMELVPEVTQETKEEAFGKPPLEAYSGDDLSEITAKVVKLRNSNGKATVWLDNDQVWQQKYSKNFRIKEGDEVVIEKKSLMGGHRLKLRGRTIEVKRLN